MDEQLLENLNLEDMAEDKGITPGSDNAEGPTTMDQLSMMPMQDIIDFLKEKQVLPETFELPEEFTTTDGMTTESAGLDEMALGEGEMAAGEGDLLAGLNLADMQG